MCRSIVAKPIIWNDNVRSEHPGTRNRSMAARKSRTKTKAARPTTVAAYLAHSGKADGDRRGSSFRLQAHAQRVCRVHELGRDQLGDPARTVLEHVQRSAALLRGPRRQEELQLALPDGPYDSATGEYTTSFAQKLLV